MHKDKYTPELELEDRRLLELTLWYKCNAWCEFCSMEPAQRQESGMRTAEILMQMAKAKKDGFRLLGLGGGEPTIYPDILKILKFGKKLGYKTIRIQTNGIKLADKEFCTKMVRYGADFFKFSMHGHTAELHDKLVKVPGAFNKCLQALENLADLEVATEVNIVINKFNYKFIPQFIAAMLNYEITRFCLIFPRYTGEMYLHSDKIGVSLSQAVPYIHEAIDLANALHIDRVLVFNVPPCYMVGYEPHMVELSDFRTKVNTPFGETASVDYAVNHDKQKVAVCNQCVLKDYCSGIYKNYYEIFGDKDIKPVINPDYVKYYEQQKNP